MVSPFSHLHLGVLAVGDPRQRRQRLALGAGAEDHHFAVGVLVELLGRDHRVRRHLQQPQLLGQVDVVGHAPPHHRDLAPELVRDLQRLLQAIDVGGEGGDDDPALGLREDGAEGVPHQLLRRRVALLLGVGGVRHEEQHALPPVLAEAADVGGVAVHRGLVKLEVAGVHDDAGRGGDRQRGGPGDGVGDVDELDAEGRQVDDVAGLDLVHHRVGQPFAVLQLLADQAQGHAGSVHWYAEAVDDERQRPDVVLVAVGQDDRLDLVGALDQVGDVGDHQVDAQHLLLGEHQAGVDDQDPAVVLDRHHVDADLAQPTEGDDLRSGPPRAPIENSVSCSVGCRAPARGRRGAPGLDLVDVALDPASCSEGVDQEAVVERCGRVVERDVGAVAPLDQLAVDPRDPRRPRQQALHGVAAEEQDHRRPDQLDLAVEVAGAGGDLVGQRVAVARVAGT